MTNKPRFDTKLASIIDHTLLIPNITSNDLQKLCTEAKQYGFASVCVYPRDIPQTATFLKNSAVKPIAVIDFPLGQAITSAKVAETQKTIADGAQEIDMVINQTTLKAKNYQLVYEDIKQVVAAASPHIVKVILETAALNNDEKIAACVLAKAAGAHFVKTSTGFGPGGATCEDVALMRRIVGPEMGVKASGGIRTREDAQKMIAAGANRLGSSASIAIVTNTLTKNIKY